MGSQIVDKVKKLLALSSSSNINEATTSAAIAHKLIVQHRLSATDLTPARTAALAPLYDDPEPVYQSGHASPWKVRLLCLIAHHYGVAVWNDKQHKISKGGRGVSRFRLIGLEEDVAIVRQLFVWLAQRVKQFADLECRGYGQVTANSYCTGVVKGIEKEFKSSQNQLYVQAIASGHESAVASVREREKRAQEYLYRQYNLLVTHEKPRKFDSEAFTRGNRVGSFIGAGPDASKGGAGTPV